MRRKKLAIGLSVAIVLVLVIVALSSFFLADFSLSPKTQLPEVDENVYLSADKSGVDAIHFLNTGSSDAIIIESNGKFAMVDAGEDSDYPAEKPSLNLKGYEDYVLDYLRKNAVGADGRVTLEFVVGTHAHSDHIGGFDTVLSADDVTVKKAYLKQYNPDFIINYEVKNWDNLEVYNQMLSVLKEKEVEIVTSADTTPFTLGDFTVQIFNGQADTEPDKKGENENSFGIKITKDGKTAFLAGDINFLDGDEKRIAEEIGDIDLLKIGHHGHILSSSRYFIKTLAPEIGIVTNSDKKVSRITLNTLKGFSVPVYPTVENDGIIAVFTDGKIILDSGYCMNMPEAADSEF